MKSKSPKQESRNQLNFIPRSKSQDLWKTLEAIRQQKQKIKLKLEKLVEKLDEFTNARTTVIFFLLFFLLGKSLNYYLIGILVLYILLITNRLIRFWIKHSLMYMLDFIYFGNICMIIFLLFYRNDLNLFLNVFACSSGVIALTVIIDNNNIELGDSDFISSTFLDCIPILSSWAIRWKHILYFKEDCDSILFIGNVEFNYDDYLKKLIIYPFFSWFLWAFSYLLLNGKILRTFAYSDLFESTICKFYHSNSFYFIVGNHKKFTILKYLFIQLCFLIISIPVVLSCFYNFYFCSGYLLFMCILLGINSARIKHNKLKGLVDTINN